jgi:hypothetical protein
MKQMVPLIAKAAPVSAGVGGSTGVEASVGRSRTAHPTNHSAVIKP